LSNFKPDVIHAEEEPDSLSAFQIALARRVFAPQAKLLLHTWQNINRPKQWYVKAIMSLSLHRCDLVMCANCEAVTVLRQQGYQNKTVVLPAVGVDTDTFKPYPVDTRNNHSFVIGFIGRLAPEKGIDTLLEALALIKGERTYQLYLIGNGPQCDQLQAQVKCLGLTGLVEFVGALPPLEVAQKLSSLHTLVLPSRTTAVWKEQLGRALLEAMAVKVPVVGSNSGAIPEVIGDAGLIFPEGDAIALAACLRRLAETPTLAQQLAEKGFQRVQQEYSQKQLAKRTAELYYELVG
jgi:glycosyltransferase involved in cell wall biosynthesis